MKGDSFSTVVKRIVPLAGTLGAMEQFVRKRRANEEQDLILEFSIEDRSPARHDPWA